jgi:hypothetical protein
LNWPEFCIFNYPDKKLLKVLDIMALSVATPEHLHKIRLLDKVENDDGKTIIVILELRCCFFHS